MTDAADQPPLATTRKNGWLIPGAFIVAIAAAWWLGLVPALGGENSPAPAERRMAPDFARPLVSGSGSVHLADWRGKVVLVNVWATWCPPCRLEIPGLSGVYRQFQDQGFAMVGVSVDRDGPEGVAVFVREHAMPYPVVMGDAGFTAAFGGVRAVPTSFLIDRQGRIVKTYVGLLPGPRLARDVKALLASPG